MSAGEVAPVLAKPRRWQPSRPKLPQCDMWWSAPLWLGRARGGAGAPRRAARASAAPAQPPTRRSGRLGAKTWGSGEEGGGAGVGSRRPRGAEVQPPAPALTIDWHAAAIMPRARGWRHRCGGGSGLPRHFLAETVQLESSLFSLFKTSPPPWETRLEPGGDFRGFCGSMVRIRARTVSANNTNA